MKQPPPKPPTGAKDTRPVFTPPVSETSMGWNIEDEDVREDLETEPASDHLVSIIFDRIKEAARKAGALAKVHAWSDTLRENAFLARDVILASIDEVTECIVEQSMRTGYIPETCEPLEPHQVKSVTADPVILMLQEIVSMQWDPVAVVGSISRVSTVKAGKDIYAWKEDEVTPVITAAIHVATRNYGHCYDACIVWHAERPRPMICIVQRKAIPIIE